MKYRSISRGKSITSGMASHGFVDRAGFEVGGAVL